MHIMCRDLHYDAAPASLSGGWAALSAYAGGFFVIEALFLVRIIVDTVLRDIYKVSDASIVAALVLVVRTVSGSSYRSKNRRGCIYASARQQK